MTMEHVSITVTVCDECGDPIRAEMTEPLPQSMRNVAYSMQAIAVILDREDLVMGDGGGRRIIGERRDHLNGCKTP